MSFCGLSKNVTAIFAGVFTLLQALLWCAIAIIALLIHACTIKTTEDITVPYLFYLVYLYMLLIDVFIRSIDGECGAEELLVTTDNETVTISWPSDGSAASYRTYVWIISYLVVSFIWAGTALLLLIGSMSGMKGVTGVKLRLPWLVITAVFLIVDVVASITYSLDISYTENLEELLEFIGLDVPDEISSSSSTSSIFGSFTMGPSIIAALFFSRVIIIWAVNLALLIHVGQDARQHEVEELCNE